MNPQNNDEVCYKWAVIEALHHEEIKHNPERITPQRPYENQYNWEGSCFLNQLRRLAVDVLFRNKKSQNIYTVCRSELNVKCKKLVNLLMIVDGGKRHYTAIKIISRFLSKLSEKTKRVPLLHKLLQRFLDSVSKR